MRLRSSCFKLVVCVLLSILLFYIFYDKTKRKVSSEKQAEDVNFVEPLVEQEKARNKVDESFMKTFEERQRKMSDYCTNKGDNGKPFLEDKRVLYAYLVDQHRKLLVCGVPKCGTTSWQKVLAAMTNPGTFQSMKSLDIGRRIYSVAPHLDGLQNLSAVSDILFDDQDYVRVISVRHPLTRLYSAWSQKFNINFVAFPYFWRKYAVRAVIRYQNGENSTEDANYPFTFESFVKFVAFEGERFSDWHWKPAVDYFCHPCKVKYDFVTFSDTLSEEANYILQEILIEKHQRKPIENWIQFPGRYKSSQSSNSILEHFYKTIPADVMERIYTLYKSDFQAFGFHNG